MKPKTMEVSERERDRYMQMLRDSRIPKEPPKGWVSAEDLMSCVWVYLDNPLPHTLRPVAGREDRICFGAEKPQHDTLL